MHTDLDHPVDDPSLPSYQHPALRDLAEDLRRAYDVFHCLRGVKASYLPQEPREPDDAYKARLERAVFTDFYRSSIHAFAGVLSKFSLANPPTTMDAATANIDMEGNSLKAWWMEVDAAMLSDGAAALQVEMPPNESGNAGVEVATGVRPYLVKRRRSRVLNWRTTDGELEWVIFLEMEEEPAGEFGVETVPYYRMVGRGFQRVYKIERDASNKLVASQVGEDVPILGANRKPLPVVPVIWYASDEVDFGGGELSLRQVVEHCLSHFRESSDLREKTHKCAMPVPVRIGAVPPAPGQKRQDAVIGPNTIIDLEAGGSFTFAEPSATSLAEQRAQIADTEKLISRQTLGFLYGDPGSTKTATQAGMEGAQTESAITRIAERKASAMQSLMALWVLFTGEPLDPGAGLAMSASIYERPMEASDVDQLHKLAGGGELISQRSAIEELQRAGRLKVTTSVEEELERLAEEVPEPADPVGLNDLGGLPPES